MADSYQQVAEAISKGLRDLLADSMHKWYGIQEIEGVSITAAPSEKGTDFKTGWTFTAVIDDAAPHQQELRIAAAAVLGMVTGLEKNHITLSMPPQKGSALTGDLSSVARSVNEFLPGIGEPKIDYFVDSTNSEISEKIQKYQKRIKKEFQMAARNDDPTKIESIAAEIVAKTKQALAIVAADNPQDTREQRISKLTGLLSEEEASIMLGINYSSHFSKNLSQAEWDDNGRPLSSTLALRGVNGDGKDTLVAGAFDAAVTDIVLQFTQAHNVSTDHYASGRTLDDAYEALNKKQPIANSSTIDEAKSKVTFCAFKIAETVLWEHAAADFKAAVESQNINAIVDAMNLDSIELPPSVSRQSYTAIVHTIAQDMVDEHAHKQSPWITTPKNTPEPRAPLYAQRRSKGEYPTTVYAIQNFVGNHVGSYYAPQAIAVAKKTEQAIKAGFKACYPGMDI